MVTDSSLGAAWYSLQETYHGVNVFLNTLPGELLKVSVSFLLLTLVTYMIISEYGRAKSKQLAYLIGGFAVLAVEKLISTFTLANIVFGTMRPQVLGVYLPIFINSMEILALVLITHAFTYPLFSRNPPTFQRNIRIGLVGAAAVFAVYEVAWLAHFSVLPIRAFQTRMFFLSLELIKVAILTYPFYKLARHHSFDKYNTNVSFAFLIYMVTPITNIVNMGFFEWSNPYLYVFAHPFPLFATVLFTRVVYLKLVDKAHLQQKLHETERKYRHQKEIVKMKDEFVSVVSHELRTPLTSMKLYLSLLLDGKLGKVTARQEEALTVVAAENNRLSDLINDILTLSKLENKKTDLRKKTCKLRKIADHRPYAGMAEKKNIVVINDIPDDILVNVDPNKFRQVFINLFTNAIKYTPSGGTVWLMAEQDKDAWTFSVRDTGIGIKEEHIKNIWKKFYQVSDYSTRKVGGTGLGLSIVKSIVEMHGGTIDVQSGHGKGSTFAARFPHGEQMTPGRS